MGGLGDAIEGALEAVFDPVGKALGLDKPKMRKPKRPKLMSPEERERAARDAAERRRLKAEAGTSYADTKLTGPGGLGEIPVANKAFKTLIGT